MSAADYSILETAVGELAGIRVGVHSAWEETWSDEGGEHTGPRATLAVMGAGDDDFDQRVHVGAVVTVAGESFEVVAIHAPDDGIGSVTVRPK